MDIVERLRSWSHAQSNHPQLLREAADEIARLQADNERLLAFIRGCSICREEYETQSRRDRDAQDARAALAPPPQR